MRFFCLLLTFAVFGATASFQATGASAGNDSKETEKAKPLTVVKKKQDWKVFTSLDLFAYSAPVSVDKFANDFDAPLESGDTAFTHDQIEVGVQWNWKKRASVI